MSAPGGLVLVTRPQPGADHTANRLSALGVEPIVSPLFEIHAVPGIGEWLTSISDQHPRAIAFTSANAPRAIASHVRTGELGWVLELPVFGVGQATAEAASRAGFTTVHVAPLEDGGNAAGLIRLIGRELAEGTGPILHPHGRDRAVDLAQALGDRNVSVLAHPVYGARAVAALPPKVEQAIQNHDVAAVLHFSPRAARHFGALAGALRPVQHHICLSQTVAEALGTGLPASYLDHISVSVADHPDEGAAIAALRRLPGLQ